MRRPFFIALSRVLRAAALQKRILPSLFPSAAPLRNELATSRRVSSRRHEQRQTTSRNRTRNAHRGRLRREFAGSCNGAGGGCNGPAQRAVRDHRVSRPRQFGAAGAGDREDTVSAPRYRQDHRRRRHGARRSRNVLSRSRVCDGVRRCARAKRGRRHRALARHGRTIGCDPRDRRCLFLGKGYPPRDS